MAIADNRMLPPMPEGPNGRALALPVEVYQGVPPRGDNIEPEQPSVPLSHYLWLLRRHRWKILAFVATSVAATLIVSKRITPIYEATSTVDVDRQTPSGVIGQESMRSVLNDADQFLATQVKLIQSDSVLRPVADKFNLRELESENRTIEAEQRGRLDAAPVLLKQLKVTRPPNTYLLLISYRSPDPRLAADVSNAIARSYIEHTYNIRIRSSASLSAFMEKQLEELKAQMERSGAALAQFERELNVISPEEKTSILSARLLQLNTEYTNAQADRMKKESAFRSVQGGSLAAAQVSSQSEALKKLSERMDEAQQKFAEVRVHFGANHPEYRKAAAQVSELERQFSAARQSIAQRVEVEYREASSREAMLQKAVAETKAEFDRLNARSFDYHRRKNEAEADKKLYEELVRKIREAGINAGFQNSAVRIADAARPPLRPVFPNIPLNLVLAFLFSSLVAVGAAVIGDVLDNTIRDSDQAAALLRLDVMGTLPQVKLWRNKLVAATFDSESCGSGTAAPAVIRRDTAAVRATTSFDEAIHTLRNSILLGSFDRPLKSLMITSASPSEGKTTTAVHLAVAHAHQGKKTLLIDGDLRRPSVHRKFGLAPEAGLASVLQNGLNWQQKVITLDSLPELDILPAGTTNRRASDLIGTSLPRILDEAGSKYDLIVVDAPPVLGFPEPLQMATAVDGVVLVAKAGETNRKAVTSVVGTLQRLRANIVGLVLNEVTKDLSAGYHYYSYYGKYYKYYRAED